MWAVNMLLVAALMVSAGCNTGQWFSTQPHSSGRIDTKPNILVVSGQSHTICRKSDVTPMVWFVHLRHMPAQQMMASVSGQTLESEFGTQGTFSFNGNTPAGKVVSFTITFLVGSWSYETTTTVGQCQ